MSEMGRPLFTHAVALLAGGVIGSMCGNLVHDGPTSDSPEGDPAPAAARVGNVRWAVENSAGAHRLEMETVVGRPIPFPDLPPGSPYAPEGVRKAVSATVEGCPNLGDPAPVMECDEYPCLVWFTGAFTDLAACPAWPYTSWGVHAKDTFVGTEGVSVPFGVYSLAPAEWWSSAEARDFERRMEVRRYRMDEVVATEWGLGPQ